MSTNTNRENIYQPSASNVNKMNGHYSTADSTSTATFGLTNGSNYGNAQGTVGALMSTGISNSNSNNNANSNSSAMNKYQQENIYMIDADEMRSGMNNHIISRGSSSNSSGHGHMYQNNAGSSRSRSSRHHTTTNHMNSVYTTTETYSRQVSKRSVNFNGNGPVDHQTGSDSIEGSVMIDQNGQILVGNEQHQASNPHETDDTHQHSEQKQIQVQILPQDDDNWGENTTAFTADFSDFNDDLTEDGRSSHFNGRTGGGAGPAHTTSSVSGKEDFFTHSSTVNCSKKIMGLLGHLLSRYFGFVCAMCVSLCAFVTPIFFIVLPHLSVSRDWQVTECGLECEGLLIGIAFKLFILLLGAWAIFVRKPKATLPRIYELRALLVFILCLITFSFWLFYAVRIIETRAQDYHKILQFAASYVDVLLFVFIIAVFVIELRHVQPQYVVKIIRSPDGEQRQYTIGDMSIQRAAVWLMEQYYKDFGVYNPWLENAHRKRANAHLLQIEQAAAARAAKKASRHGEDSDDKLSTRKMSSSSRLAATSGVAFTANDRFHEEYDYERRLRKRRARLLTTCEEAFTHIRRMQSDAESANTTNNTNGTGAGASGSSPTLMDPYEAAQAIFTSIARDLRRYLRVTRQQPYFTRESIVAHLANCVSYDMSPRSFLQRYLNPEPLIFNERALVSASTEQNKKLSSVLSNGLGSHGVNYHLNLKTLDQSWILICDTVLYQGIEDNLMFVLKQNEVSLMCTFKRLPYFNLIEDILDPQRNKFVLKLNSETTV